MRQETHRQRMEWLGTHINVHAIQTRMQMMRSKFVGEPMIIGVLRFYLVCGGGFINE